LRPEVETVYGISGPIGYVRGPGVAWTYPSTESVFSYLELSPPVDECHYCGAPSPGDVCRYCGVVHREQDPSRCAKCGAEYSNTASAMDNFGETPLITRVCGCKTAKVYEVSRLGTLRYLRTVVRATGECAL
jgi:hypothetical protein